jgi:hypothetical protein
MGGKMTPEEFQRLAQAYGAVVARWPSAQRSAAEAYCAAWPEQARRVLAEAEALDLALDAWLPLNAGQDLRDRVIGLATSRATRGQGRTWLWPTGIGIGLASACAAGLVLGVSLSQAPAGSVLSDEPVNAVMTGYELPGPQETSSTAT